MAHTFRVQQSLSTGELSPEVLVSYVQADDFGPLLFEDRSPKSVDGNASDGSLPMLIDGTSSESGSSTSSSVPDLEDVAVAERAMVPSTVCGENRATVVQQMWHYNDLDVLSGPDYLAIGPECEEKLAFALLHGTDPRLVTLNVLHRAGITDYRQTFDILIERSPLPEQRWINAVMQQSGPAPGPSFVPFEATATPQSVANQIDWSTLVHRTAAHNFGQ